MKIRTKHLQVWPTQFSLKRKIILNNFQKLKMSTLNKWRYFSWMISFWPFSGLHQDLIILMANSNGFVSANFTLSAVCQHRTDTQNGLAFLGYVKLVYTTFRPHFPLMCSCQLNQSLFLTPSTCSIPYHRPTLHCQARERIFLIEWQFDNVQGHSRCLLTHGLPTGHLQLCINK
jgi:hypothetical protein